MDELKKEVLTKKSADRSVEYAKKIVAHLGEIFKSDNEHFINEDEFVNDRTFTEFIYALSVIMPTHVYNRMTQQKADYLDFNHVANKLCFQFGIIDIEEDLKKEQDEKEE